MINIEVHVNYMTRENLPYNSIEYIFSFINIDGTYSECHHMDYYEAPEQIIFKNIECRIKHHVLESLGLYNKINNLRENIKDMCITLNKPESEMPLSQLYNINKIKDNVKIIFHHEGSL